VTEIRVLLWRQLLWLGSPNKGSPNVLNLNRYAQIVVEKHSNMQRLNKNIDRCVRLVLVFSLFSAGQGWSDDLDSMPGPVDEVASVDMISTAKDCFAKAKQRGTVWLKTQQAMDRMLILEKDGTSSKAIQIARNISRDCQLISNQHALEQARYLLSTMETNGFDDDALNAIRVQLAAGDGEASLALANSLQRELESGSNAFQDQNAQMEKEQ